MLRCVQRSDQQHWYVFSNVDIDSLSIDIVLSNGTKIWFPVNLSKENIMPNSRRHQSIQDYMNTLKSALQDPLLDGNIFEFVEGTGNLSFVIKQSVEGSTTKTLLFKHEFHEVLLQQGIFDLYDKIGGVLARQREAILSLETNLALSQSTILSLQSDMQQFVDEKETSQDQMVRGMCLLLNTKKREIERLRRELPHQDNDDDMNDSDQAVEVSSKPKETKRNATKTKAAASIKRKKEPERTPSYLVSQSQELSGDNIIDYLSQPATKSRQTKRAASQSKSKAPATKAPKKTKRKAKESSSEEEDEALDTETSEDDIDLHLDSASDPEHFQETDGRQDLDDGEDSDFGGAEDRAAYMNLVTPGTTLSSRVSSLPNTTQESISLSQPSTRYSSKRAPAIAKSTLSMSSNASNDDLSRKNIGSIQGKSSSKDATSIESQTKDKVPALGMAKVRKTAMQRMLGSDSENSS